MGDEVPDTERSDLSPVSLQYLSVSMASWTMDQLGRKPDQWFFWKQGAKRQVALQLL
jgi:hypothetical protein